MWDGARWLSMTWFGGIGIADEITAMVVAKGRLIVGHRVVVGFGYYFSLSYWGGAWIPIEGVPSHVTDDSLHGLSRRRHRRSPLCRG